MQKTKEIEAIAGIGFFNFRIVCFFFDLPRNSKTRTFVFAADDRRTIKTRGDTAPNVGLIDILFEKLITFIKGIHYKVRIILFLTM